MTTPTTLQRHAPRSRTRVRTWIKRSALLAAGIAAVSGLVYAWLPSPVSVDVDVVSRAPLSVEIVEDGRTRVRDRYVVSAPTSGNLKRIELEAGASVVAGDVVAWIEPPVPALLDARMRDEAAARLTAATAHYRRAQTEVTRAQVARDLATKEAQRALTLAARGAIAGSERDRLETEAQLAIRGAAAAQTELAAASAEIAAARAVLGQGSKDSRKPIPVMAPASGRILRILRDSAGPIAGGMGLVEIGDPRAMEVVVDVLSADAARIRTGMEATIENWGGDPLRGRVRIVEPSGFTRISALGVEEQRVNIVVAIEPLGAAARTAGSTGRREPRIVANADARVIDPAHGQQGPSGTETPATPEQVRSEIDDSPIALGDGYRVDVRIVVWHGTDVLAVPTSAVFRHQNAWAVYVVDNGRAMLRKVELSHRGRNRVEVSGGIVEGARVVLHPGDRVTEGARVRVR